MTTGYARLVGRIGNNNDGNVKEYTKVITSIPAILGRGEDSVVVDTEDTTISRKHILLDWDESKNVWSCKCLSKNGIIVDKVKLSQDESAVIDNGSAIKLGTAKLYFTLPYDKKRKFSSSGSPPDEKKKRGSAAGLNEISIIPDPTEPYPSENIERINYIFMVKSCFDAVPRSYDMNQGIMMTWLVNWILARFPVTTAGLLQSSVNKGIFGALQKIAERTDADEHVILKCTRWKLKPNVQTDNFAD